MDPEIYKQKLMHAHLKQKEKKLQMTRAPVDS